MFWRFGGYQSIPTINSLLEKPNVTVEEVLDEADLLQELKENNTKLIEYLRDDDVLKRLLDYIVSPSLIDDDDDDEDEDEDEDEDDSRQKEESEKIEAGEKDKAKASSSPEAGSPRRESDGKDKRSSPELTQMSTREELEEAERSRLKYAYMASEVLSAPTWSVIEAITLHETALRDFWHFLWSKAPLSAVQTNYFVKVNEVLLDKKPVEMVSFVMSLEGVVDNMLRHVDNPLVMDLLLKVISLDRVSDSIGTTEWLRSYNLIPDLLSCLSPSHTSSTQTSAGEFLKALITISANAALNEQPCIGPNSLTRQLVSDPCVQTLINCILQGGNPLTVAVGVIIEIIRKNNPDYDPESMGNRDTPPTLHDPIYLGTLLRMFASHIPDFMELLHNPNHTDSESGGSKRFGRAPLSTAWGEKTEPLGFDRFKVCELMAELLHCSNMGLHNEPGSHEFMAHRDSERERLRNEGAFAVRSDEESGYIYPDAANDAINGTSPSFIGSGSPDEMRRFDNAHTGEEDGFEDVAFSGVMVKNPKDNAEAGTEADTSHSGLGTFTPVSKLGMDDDFVDEPLTPPESEEASAVRPPDVQPSQSQNVEPASPATSTLTEKVGEFKIESTEQSKAESQSSAGSTSPKPGATVGPLHSPTSEAQRPSATSETAPQGSWPSNEILPSGKQDGGAQVSGNAGAASEPYGATSAESSFNAGPTDQEQIHTEANGQPVSGDYLKIMLFEHKVIPTIFAFFFRFAWNNFLHHVVYDVVQQILNGPTDEGFNRSLVVDLFDTGEITTKIVEGQRRSEQMESTKKLRMGYMGHLTLIAEEVVRFTERQSPDELPPTVMEKVLHPDWANYVEHALSEARERESAILGGVKPDVSMCHRQAVLNAINNQDFAGSSALANAGLNGGVSNSAFEGFDFMNPGTATGGAFGLSGIEAGGSSLLSGFGNSSDDEDEDMDDHDEESTRKGLQVADAEGASSSANSDQPIPILPPPAPLSTGPSRARRQLAARLARRKEANDAANASETDLEQHPSIDRDRSQFPDSNPHAELSSPPSYLPRTSAVSTYATTSGDADTSDSVSTTLRPPPHSFDVDDYVAHDDIGDMVGTTAGVTPVYDDDDDDDDGLVSEPLDYSSFFGNPKGPTTMNQLALDSEEQSNSSEEDDDEGLVEISVSGRRLPSS